MTEEFISQYADTIDGLYARCSEDAPNFGVTSEMFKNSVGKALVRFLEASPESYPTETETTQFLEQLQVTDLFLAIACANGNERAWWEFDQQHRSYIERLARHLAKTDIDAQEVIDSVYVDLYGTRVVDGARVSKFATYSGRGGMRGWLRTVIWHSLVDLHRASHDEVSLDEMTETVGEGAAHASFVEPPPGGEQEMIEHIAQQRYRSATLASIQAAFESLDDHEKLLLLYYHVDQLKLREIARLVEAEESPLRAWFQRRSESREKNPRGRIYESTIMRWLDRSYEKILRLFKNELASKHNLSLDEIAICLGLATQDLGGGSIFRNLAAKSDG